MKILGKNFRIFRYFYLMVGIKQGSTVYKPVDVSTVPVFDNLATWSTPILSASSVANV